MHGNPTSGEDWWGHRNTYRTTAPDPASVSAMREFVKEIVDSGVVFSSNPLDHVKATGEWWEKARILLGGGTDGAE